MKRNNVWLKTAARAHAALTQHRLHVTEQARTAANTAEQRAMAAASDVHELAQGWTARRQRGQVDTSLDQAYADFHRHLAARSALCDEAASQANTTLASVTADLRMAHGTTQVLEEILARRQKEQVVEDTKKELQGLGESWLLARGQYRDHNE